MNCLNKLNGWKVRAVPALLEPKIFQACCRVLEQSDRRFEQVHSSAKTAVFRFNWAGGNYYLKHYLFKGWRKQLRLRAKVRKLSKIADRMNLAGFHTPSIVGFAFNGRNMFSVSEAVAADSTVYELYCNNRSLRNMSRFRELFGREIGRLHAAGFVHGDLRWGNVLVKNPDSDCPEFIYLDNDRTRRYRKTPARGRIRNLVQIYFTELLKEDQPAIHWEDFWRGYCSANLTFAVRSAYWKNRVDRATARRVYNWRRKPDHHERLAGRTS